MKRPPEKLLDDLLEESAPPEFRAALLDRTLRQARRRKNFRRLNSALAVAACAAILALAFFKTRRQAPIVANQVPRPDLIVVHSRPLNPAQIVSTQPRLVNMVSSSALSFTLVETHVSERLYAEIDDQQLFALLAGRPVALVHRGPNRAELIFLNPADANGFPVQ